MLTQNNVKSAGRRDYEAAVERAFRRYVEATPAGVSDIDQADARRQYVNEVHSIRATFAQAYPDEDFGPVSEPGFFQEKKPLFEVVAFLVVDVNDGD